MRKRRLNNNQIQEHRSQIVKATKVGVIGYLIIATILSTAYLTIANTQMQQKTVAQTNTIVTAMDNKENENIIVENPDNEKSLEERNKTR